MQLDLFFRNIIGISVYDGLALGLCSGFILVSCLGLYITRSRPSRITWSIGSILSIILGTLGGFGAMVLTGLVASWAGSGIYGLSGTDLSSWNDLVILSFSSYQSQVLVLSYLGSIAGLGMGFGIGSRPNDNQTRQGIVIAVLGVCALLGGFTLALLPTLITWAIEELYIVAAGFTGLMGIYALYRVRNHPVEGPDIILAQEVAPE